MNRITQWISKQRLVGLINMNEPHLWYKETRELSPRTIICHIGPTNSGKTYTSLKSLQQSKKGIYCGPLRLLAWEVAETLRDKGVKCSLITGQERDIILDYTHVSCTIEMADLNNYYDCAVIDEMQVIGDDSRGWAWTQALLGLKSKEIHLCGNSTFLNLVEKICKQTNDQIIVHEYKRKSPLKLCTNSLKSLTNVTKGDCVIAFSRKELYRIKQSIEKENPSLKCCIIYGSLPPDARKQQALLFNNQDNNLSRSFNVLVASDAIGMGLNLSIKRIIFSTLQKFDGKEERDLYSTEIKQIAGRAGRFGSLYEDGEVTVLDANDHSLLKNGLQAVDTNLLQANLFPTKEQLELLGAFIDTKISSNDLSNYWLIMFERIYGIKEGNKQFHMIDTNQFHTTSFILKYFQSISLFAYDLEIYVRGLTFDNSNNNNNNTKKKKNNYNDNINEYSPKKNELDLIIEEYQQDNFDSENDDSNSKNYNYYEDYEEDEEDDEDEDEDEDVIDPLTKTRDGPKVPLDVLFGIFKRCVKYEKDSLYKIGDLHDKQMQALIIANIKLSFKDRYTFCLAPLNIENERLRKVFYDLTSQFSKKSSVKLKKKFIPELCEAKTPDELLALETSHKVCDLFLWLAFRYPDRFPNVDKIEHLREKCGEFIDSSLKNMKHHKKLKKKEITHLKTNRKNRLKIRNSRYSN